MHGRNGSEAESDQYSAGTGETCRTKSFGQHADGTGLHYNGHDPDKSVDPAKRARTDAESVGSKECE